MREPGREGESEERESEEIRWKGKRELEKETDSNGGERERGREGGREGASKRAQGREEEGERASERARDRDKERRSKRARSSSVLSKTAIFPKKQGRKREISTNMHGVGFSGRPTSR